MNPSLSSFPKWNQRSESTKWLMESMLQQTFVLVDGADKVVNDRG